MARCDESVVNVEPVGMDHPAAVFFKIVASTSDYDFYFWNYAADGRLGLNEMFKSFVVPNPAEEQNCFAVIRARQRTCRSANCHVRYDMHAFSGNAEHFDYLPAQGLAMHNDSAATPEAEIH